MNKFTTYTLSIFTILSIFTYFTITTHNKNSFSQNFKFLDKELYEKW